MVYLIHLTSLLQYYLAHQNTGSQPPGQGKIVVIYGISTTQTLELLWSAFCSKPTILEDIYKVF